MIEYPAPYWKDYALVDSGDGQKLEKFGDYTLIRPEPKALWKKSLPDSEWTKLAHTRFRPGAGFGRAGKEDSGTWERLKKNSDQWYISYPLPGSGGKAFSLRLGLTSFKHVGVFPEQAPNWDYIYSNTLQIAETLGRKPRILNLFAYTGAASLAALSAGAEVTHLDSVKQVVTWARGNMESSSLDGIRWIVEDAMKFVKRQQRRGSLFDGIIMDPPAYGHGPDGEKWKLDECLFEMLQSVNSILSPKDSFLVLNLYSNGFSPLMGKTVLEQAFSLKAGVDISAGELALNDSFGKALPLSVVVRLRR